MSDPNDEKPAASGSPVESGPGDELREGLQHLFKAARKVIQVAEPAVSRSFDDAERVLGKLGRGGEAVAAEVSKEVATLATRLADRLRTLANRPTGEGGEGGAGGEAGNAGESEGSTGSKGHGTTAPLRDGDGTSGKK